MVVIRVVRLILASPFLLLCFLLMHLGRLALMVGRLILPDNGVPEWAYDPDFDEEEPEPMEYA